MPVRTTFGSSSIRCCGIAIGGTPNNPDAEALAGVDARRCQKLVFSGFSPKYATYIACPVLSPGGMPAYNAKPPVSTADQSRIGEILQWSPTALLETNIEGHRIVIGGGGP
jgi:hypothetical protein